uniref:Succinate dehydrogenase assembly factor 4, mitochondrial n=1 Tax=Moniliophthora roreri TaxID=221103 RepID=A0A0W0FGW7_MONRR
MLSRLSLQPRRFLNPLRISYSSYPAGWNRPSPPPLPREQQLEFEELQRAVQTPLAKSPLGTAQAYEADLSIHPDARKPLKPAFEGDINPITGEQGGPKQEPVGKWGEEGDWSFKGRVSDF